MKYRLHFSKAATKQIADLRKSSDKVSCSKLMSLLEEIGEHPYHGTGKPEELKGDLSNLWSRRINHKDRLIYRVEDDIVTVTVVQVRGHYSDKG